MKDFRITKKSLVLFLCIFVALFAITVSATTAKDITAPEHVMGNSPEVHTHIYGDWSYVAGMEPTCKTSGKRQKVCIYKKGNAVCGHIYVEDVPADPSAHVQGGEEQVTKLPTCKELGTGYYTCEKCNEKIETYSNYTSHTFEGEWTVVPGIHDETKEVEGVRFNTCTTCKTTVEEKIPIEHDFKYQSEKAATCIERGYLYEYCSICKKTKEIRTPIDESNHVYSGNPLPITDIVCGIGGKGIVTCEGCGAIDYVTIPGSAAHNYVEWSYKEPVGTCINETSQGVVIKKCDDCKVVIEEKHWSGHILGDDAKTRAATCSKYGYKTGKCTLCGVTADVVFPADENAHAWIETVIKEPTCEEKGYVFRMCKYDASHVEYDYIDPIEHTYYYDWTIVEEATCSRTGKKTNYCFNCYQTITVDIPVDPDNHQLPEDSWETYLGKEPTCDSEGMEFAFCDKCVKGEVYRVTPKHSKTLTEIERKEPTCSTKGYIKYICTSCGGNDKDEDAHIIETLPIVSTAHKISQEYHVTRPATCSEEIDDYGLVKGLGIRSKICEYCFIPIIILDEESEHKIKTFDKTPHIVTEWTIKNGNEATCTKEGLKTRSCISCKHVQSEIIPINHSYQKWIDITTQEELDKQAGKPECQVIRTRERGCESCSELFTETYKTDCVAGAWTAVKWDDKTNGWITDSDANCLVGGTFRKSCIYCEKHMMQKNVAAGEHFDLMLLNTDFRVSDRICSKTTYLCKHCNKQVIKTTSHTLTSYTQLASYDLPHDLCDNKNCTKEHTEIAGIAFHTNCTQKDCKLYHQPLKAVCGENGWTEKYFCMTCQYVVEQSYINAIEHVFDYDEDGTKYCINCTLYYVSGDVTCDHFCHNRGTIAKVLTKVFTFFWKIFGLNQVCECGVPHYEID